MTDRFKQNLNVASNALVVLASLVVIVDVSYSRFVPHAKQQTVTHHDSRLSVSAGQKLDLPGVVWSAHRFTVVFALTRHCPYCAASMPFYRRLVTSLPQTKDVDSLVIAPDGEELMRSYLRESDLHVNEVKMVQLSRSQIPGTPTLIIVNRDGVIQRAWLGQLAGQTEQEVLTYLAGV